ncbi:MAG: cell division protein [Bacteroidetes bacterium]|nr:cell division protein [Bacteroidota bacterium]
MNNDELDRHLYKYPGSEVLRNKLEIGEHKDLDRLERQITTRRSVEGVPSGGFDLKHLQAIHKHLFQDVYEWAGEIRQTQIHKGGSVFMPPNRISFGFQDVHKRLNGQNYLQGLPQDIFAKKAGVVIGNVNYAHPFREGNGRTQLHYLKQLGERAGYKIDLTRLDKDEWTQASIEAMKANYDKMEDCIFRSVTGRTRPQEQSRSMDFDRGR